MSTKNDIDNIYRQIKFYMILSEYEKYGLKYYRFRSMTGACDECANRSEIIFFASEALNNRHCFDSHPNCKCVVELINASGEVLLTLDADGNVKKSILDSISELLTYASLVPGVDTIADIAAIPVDLLRGDFVSAGLDLLGAIPIVGEVADTAKIAKTVDKAIDVGKVVDKATDAGQIVKNNKRVFVFTKKAEALKNVDNLPQEIQRSAKSFFKGSSNNYNKYCVTKNRNKTYTITMENPGKVPGSKAVYNKVVDDKGNTIKVYKDTFDPNGNLLHRKDK